MVKNWSLKPPMPGSFTHQQRKRAWAQKDLLKEINELICLMRMWPLLPELTSHTLAHYRKGKQLEFSLYFQLSFVFLVSCLLGYCRQSPVVQTLLNSLHLREIQPQTLLSCPQLTLAEHLQMPFFFPFPNLCVPLSGAERQQAGVEPSQTDSRL